MIIIILTNITILLLMKVITIKIKTTAWNAVLGFPPPYLY